MSLQNARCNDKEFTIGKARPRFVLLREENESQHVPQLAGAAMTVSMFYQYLLLHYAAKMYVVMRTARTEVPCYY